MGDNFIVPPCISNNQLRIPLLVTPSYSLYSYFYPNGTDLRKFGIYYTPVFTWHDVSNCSFVTVRELSKNLPYLKSFFFLICYFPNFWFPGRLRHKCWPSRQSSKPIFSLPWLCRQNNPIWNLWFIWIMNNDNSIYIYMYIYIYIYIY